MHFCPYALKQQFFLCRKIYYYYFELARNNFLLNIKGQFTLHILIMLKSTDCSTEDIFNIPLIGFIKKKFYFVQVIFVRLCK